MKRCGCGRDHSNFETLTYVGVQVFPACGGYPEERLVLFNCECGSTLSFARELFARELLDGEPPASDDTDITS